MIVLGIILVLVGVFAKISIVTTIGVIILSSAPSCCFSARRAGRWAVASTGTEHRGAIREVFRHWAITVRPACPRPRTPWTTSLGAVTNPSPSRRTPDRLACLRGRTVGRQQGSLGGNSRWLAVHEFVSDVMSRGLLVVSSTCRRSRSRS